MKCKLADICQYRKNKIDVASLTKNTYISTENMLPNKGGIMEAASLPTTPQTQAFKAGDVLVSNIRPYFKKIWHASFDGGCSNDVLVFHAIEGVDATFLYYVLANDKFFEYSMATAKGTKMPRGDKSAIMEYEVPKFDVNTQKKIASILKAIDDKIAVNKAINENLENQMESMYSELFEKNVDSAWVQGTLSDIGTIVGGGTPSKSKPEYYTDNGIAWITPRDLSIDKSKFVSHGETDISELGFVKSSATKMPKGTVLFSSRAPIGYIAIAANEVTTNQGFKSVVPNNDIGTAYVYYFLKKITATIESMASGSTFKEISGTGMKSVPVIIPDSITITKFNSFCEPLLEKQQILEKQNRNLSSLRDTLLQKLMSGKLDVSDLDF